MEAAIKYLLQASFTTFPNDFDTFPIFSLFTFHNPWRDAENETFSLQITLESITEVAREHCRIFKLEFHKWSQENHSARDDDTSSKCQPCFNYVSDALSRRKHVMKLRNQRRVGEKQQSVGDWNASKLRNKRLFFSEFSIENIFHFLFHSKSNWKRVQSNKSFFHIFKLISFPLCLRLSPYSICSILSCSGELQRMWKCENLLLAIRSALSTRDIHPSCCQFVSTWKEFSIPFRKTFPILNPSIFRLRRIRKCFEFLRVDEWWQEFQVSNAATDSKSRSSPWNHKDADYDH